MSANSLPTFRQQLALARKLMPIPGENEDDTNQRRVRSELEACRCSSFFFFILFLKDIIDRRAAEESREKLKMAEMEVERAFFCVCPGTSDYSKKF